MAYGIIELAKNLAGVKPDYSSLRKHEFWALQDINFELKKGEILGLIGVNGSGKTTLLRLLAGLFPPDTGEIRVEGRMGALIAVGAGFHPHMTGRENIYLNGVILGMSRKEIDGCFDDIVNFAEIKEFLDAPVSTYSSGMRVRLGFAIAVHINPDVLLIDEVLAVGDLNFTMKCFNAIDKLTKNAAVIYVSHNVDQVRRICNKVIVLEEGRISFASDNVDTGVDYYISKLKPVEPAVHGSERAKIHSVKVVNERIESRPGKIIELEYKEDFSIEIAFSLESAIEQCIINIQFHTRTMAGAAQCLSKDCGFDVINKGDKMRLRVAFSNMRLSPGKYSITVGITDMNRSEILVVNYAALEFQVVGAIAGNWPIQLDGKWEYV